MAHRESGFDFSAEICKGVTLDDLDKNAIRAFRETWATNSGNKRILTLSTEQLLRDCDAITEWDNCRQHPRQAVAAQRLDSGYFSVVRPCGAFRTGDESDI